MTGLVIALAVGIASWFWVRTVPPRQTRVDAWRTAVRRLGLTDTWEQNAIFRPTSLGGRLGNLQLGLLPLTDGEGDTVGTRIVVAGLGHGEPGLSARREDLTTALGKRFGAREVEIGDPSFDDEHYIQGPAPLALALLDAGTRAGLGALLRGELGVAPRETARVHASLKDGVLEVGVRDGQCGPKLARLADVVAAVLRQAERLTAPPDLAARIAENLALEPEPGVRRQCIATLAREFPDHPATRDAVLRSLADLDADVRLQAGLSAGPAGRAALLAIAGGEGAADETTSRAVAALAGELTVEEASALLRSALRSRRLGSARECIVVLGSRGGAAAVDLLSRVLAVEAGELAWAAARGLAATRDAAAEAPLLRALTGGARDVRLAAAAALGHVGTAAAVGPLCEAESQDGEMGRVARQAVAQIQSRLVGAEPGQLSLAGGEAGQLSIAGAGEGRLSLATSSAGASVESGVQGSAALADPLRARKRQADG